MRFLNCLCGLLTSNIIERIDHYPVILNTRFTPPLFSDNEHDKFNYGSEERRRFKDLSNIRYLVQDHHCIPRQFRNHKLIREIYFDVNCSRNILIMPTRLGVKELNLDPNTLVHEGGHPRYNKYVGSQLEKINDEYDTLDEKRYQIWLFLHYLKDNLHYKNDIIPWE
jgi:hypothetical protein